MKKPLMLMLFCAALSAQAAAAAAFGSGVYVGGKVEIDEPVPGNVVIAAGKATINASVGGNVKIAAGHVLIDAPIGGNVKVAAGKLELGPKARIAGKLRYHADMFDRDPGAEIAGGIVEAGSARHAEWEPTLGHWILRAIWTLGLMVIAAVIAGAMPGATRRMQEELRARPWMAALTGFVALICIPAAAILAMITIIGIPLGLLAILGYFALLLVGYVSASVALSGVLLDRFKADAAAGVAWRIGAAVLAVLVIALLGSVPIVGGLVALAALVFGVGVIVAAILHRKAPPAAA